MQVISIHFLPVRINMKNAFKHHLRQLRLEAPWIFIKHSLELSTVSVLLGSETHLVKSCTTAAERDVLQEISSITQRLNIFKVPCTKKNKKKGEREITARIKKNQTKTKHFLLAIPGLHYNHCEINALTSICTIPIFVLPHQCWIWGNRRTNRRRTS